MADTLHLIDDEMESVYVLAGVDEYLLKHDLFRQYLAARALGEAFWTDPQTRNT